MEDKTRGDTEFEYEYNEDTPDIIGNCRVFFYTGRNPYFVFGPDLKYYIITSIFIVLFTSVSLIFVIAKVTLVGMLIGVVIFLLQVGSHFMTTAVNPGIPDRNPGAINR